MLCMRASVSSDYFMGFLWRGRVNASGLRAVLLRHSVKLVEELGLQLKFRELEFFIVATAIAALIAPIFWDVSLLSSIRSSQIQQA